MRSRPSSDQFRHWVRMRLEAFPLPPACDGIILGREAPVGSVAMQRALELLSSDAFVKVDFDDEVVAAVFVRSPLLKKLDEERLATLVTERIKPSMSPEEALCFEVEHEMRIETLEP